METRKRKQKRGRKAYYFLGGILALLVIGGVVWYFRSALMTGEIHFTFAQTGTIKHQQKVTAIFANQEQPVTAPSSGTIQFIGNDGQRFRRGETIAQLLPVGAAPGSGQTAASINLSAGQGGLFFHQSDGLETIMTSENLLSMDLGKLTAQTSKVKITGQTVQSGDIVGKVVNNLMPTLAFLQLPEIDKLTTGKTLRITIGNLTMNAKILRLSESPMGVVVQFPQYVDGSATNRRQDVLWDYSPQTSGVIVPRSALWTQGNDTGVFVSSAGVIHFKKVKVLDEDDQEACIGDTDDSLQIGVPVVTNPRDGLEGLVAEVKNI